jgi:hypothetical protein
MIIRNCIGLCQDPRRREIPPERYTVTAVHRISFANDRPTDWFPDVEPIPDDELTGPLMASRFLDTRQVGHFDHHWADRPGSYSGGETPYHLLVRTDGTIDQCLEIGDMGSHARRWNTSALGVAVVGDFRSHPPTAKQWDSLVDICALLLSWGCCVRGHDEMLGAGNPDKRCPGRHLDMAQLRESVTESRLSRLGVWPAERRLVVLGVVF